MTGLIVKCIQLNYHPCNSDAAHSGLIVFVMQRWLSDFARVRRNSIFVDIYTTAIASDMNRHTLATIA